MTLPGRDSTLTKEQSKATDSARIAFPKWVLLPKEIPWNCRQLVIGSVFYGRLPVMKEVELEAKRRNVQLIVLQTSQAIDLLNSGPKATNAILHVTC